MRNPQLKLMDLVLGLERFGDRYSAIQVFADDVLEARSAEPVLGLSGLDREGRRFRYTVPEGRSHAGESYDLDLFPDAGVLQMRRAAENEPTTQGLPPRDGLTGALADQAVRAARRKRGEAAAEDLVLGLLVGTTLKGSTRPHAARRVFTLRFEPSTGGWRAYDGGLVRWMKEQLLPQSA
jgi:hypothetical protein